MTKINRLVIHGFKSFANKTEMVFGNEYNCILGPNGSGKSNIGDAICFVLGRTSAKSMRAEKSSNLLWNGGIKKKEPASKGFVSIHFDNSAKEFPVPEEEVVVSRIISKDGNSKYKLNGKTVTRNEILDTMSAARIYPDGYNIVLQGDITRFVEMPTTERRKIIEEISDISVYEEKKHKAMLELDKVDNQLKESDIILTERKTHLRELKTDRDQALRFKELKERINSNKATYLDIQIKEKEKVKDELTKQINELQSKVTVSEKNAFQIRDQINNKKEQIKQLNREIESKGEKEQVRVHKEIEKLKEDLARDKTRFSMLKEELGKLAQRKEELKKENKETEDKIGEMRKQAEEQRKELSKKAQQLQEFESKISSFKKKNQMDNLGDLEKEIEEKDKLIEQKQDEIQKLRLEQQNLLREKDRMEFQLNSLDEQISKVAQVEQENKDQIKSLKDKKEIFKSSTLKLNQCLELDSSMAAQINQQRKKISTLQETLGKLTAQSMAAREGLSLNMAVKRILERKGKVKGIHGTIAELGKVKRGYALAMESAAGGKSNFIVVDDDKIAAECIKYLKENKFGTASFIPLNKIKSVDITAGDRALTKEKGVHGFAIDLIDFDSRFKNAFSNALGNTLVVDHVDRCREIGIGKIRMVTLDGDLAEFSGIMKGGFKDKRATHFSEKESMEDLENCEKEISSSQSQIEELERRRELNDKEIERLRKLKIDVESEVLKLEKTLHLGDSDLDASKDKKKELAVGLKEIENKLSVLQKQIAETNKLLADLKIHKQQSREKVSTLKDPSLLAQLSAFEESKRKIREEQIFIENEIKNTESRIKEQFSADINKIGEILKQQEKEDKRFREEMEALKTNVSVKEDELKVKEKESAEFYALYKGLFSQRDKLSTEISKMEEEVEKFRDKGRGVEIELNKYSLKNAENNAKMAGLLQEFEQYKTAPLLKSKSEEELKSEIEKFERMLANMSSVNMKALEIYEQVETEYNALLEKKNKLAVEKDEVVKMMGEIESKKKGQFMKTFEVINKNFQRIFSLISHKGTAFLDLENEKNPFDAGVEIKVKLVGNRYMDMKSLSGGEKSLTTLAFIFSIQEHCPASFYILDEIDAALDKSNSEKLSRLVREYVNRAQYLVISHNDSVISEADNLYGISMDEFGISKVTTLRV